MTREHQEDLVPTVSFVYLTGGLGAIDDGLRRVEASSMVCFHGV
jgi:hypothetical protein